jgi:hypothetical protein
MSAENPEIISRSAAKTLGRVRYYVPGKKCKRGHDAERIVSNGACVMCNRLTPAKKQAERAAEKAARGEIPPQVPDIVKHMPTPVFVSGFQWTAENMSTLIDTYVDTGDMAGARDAIGVRPSEYERELERNHDFAAAVQAAEPKAKQRLEERLLQVALQGNHQALLPAIKAHFDEYKDKSQGVKNPERSISDAELSRRIDQLHQRLGIKVGTAGVPETAGGAGVPSEAEQAADDIPGDGEVLQGQVPEAS